MSRRLVWYDDETKEITPFVVVSATDDSNPSRSELQRRDAHKALGDLFFDPQTTDVAVICEAPVGRFWSYYLPNYRGRTIGFRGRVALEISRRPRFFQ